MQRLLEVKTPLIPSVLWQEIKKVRERNRKLQLKIGAERRENIEKISELEDMIQAKKAQLATLTADREDLAQLKKQVKEDAAEIHREGMSIKIEKVRWQRELSDARDELADAKSTMLNQGNKIRELERGYSLKPNPAESRLRLEIGELRSQLAEQNPAPAIDLSEKAWDVYSVVKPWLVPKAPKSLRSDIEKKLKPK